MLRTRYERGTKDGDILQTRALDDRVKAQLLEVAGPRSKLCVRHRIFVDVIAEALPLLSRKPLWHSLEPSPGLVHFEVQVLDVVDVVVSKLKRLHSDDLADIAAMIDLGLVTHGSLLECFRDAVVVYQDGAGADDLPRCVRNLHRVERDLDELDLKGHADWRLPSIDELRSIVDCCATFEAGGSCALTEASSWDDAGGGCLGCDAQAEGLPDGECYWPETLHGACWRLDSVGTPVEYWTSTANADAPDEWAAFIFFQKGLAGFNHKVSYADVRCVRDE